jgi:hypothetical protein
VTTDRLRRVERAEAALRALGVAGDLRVRDHGDLARVELDAAELSRWLAAPARAALRTAVCAAGFARVAVDLRGFPLGLPERPLQPRHRMTTDRSDAAGAILAHVLGSHGLPCTVEERERLALIVPTGDVDVVADAALRRQLSAAAAVHGFTHLAIELLEPDDRAPVRSA